MNGAPTTTATTTTTTGQSPPAAPGPRRPEPRGLRVPPVLMKILVTSLVFVIALLVTNALDQKQGAGDVWNLTASVVIGGAALIVQYLVDFEKRLEEIETGQSDLIRDVKDNLVNHHVALTELVDDRFRQINAATELFSNVDRSVLRSDAVIKLARRATECGQLNNETVKTFASLEIERLAGLLENLSSRSADCLGENQDWLIGLTQCISHSLDATSTSVDRDFWDSEPAARYLEAQTDAVSKGVTIRRLFLVDIPEEIDDEVRALCSNQRALNIDARLVALSELPPWARHGTKSDFIVFDRELSYEIDQDTNDVNAKTTLNARSAHVEHRMRQFTRLWDATLGLPDEGIPQPAH
ncbi:hypothetical protein ACQEWB_16190 [Streptomyces sp. CA-249302]|uniref:hypothetical protein n=1 Tax=Streptomyces sp. CA-249302 TaxID=3240058 RepID=UPI003D9397E2